MYRKPADPPPETRKVADTAGYNPALAHPIGANLAKEYPSKTLAQLAPAYTNLAETLEKLDRIQEATLARAKTDTLKHIKL